jgi:hypothetical protein
MRKLTLVLPMLFVLLFPFSIQAQTDFPSIDAFLKSTLKATDELSVQAKGDVNEDGLEDWAGVINRRPADSSATYQLFVFLQVRNGGYHLAEKSREEEIPGMGCCWVESLEISGASVYIQNNGKTGDTMEAATHQFKLYRGEWRLVGLKISYTDFRPKLTAENDTEMNLLTGLVVEKRQKGDNKPVVTKRRRKFAKYLLKDFDFSGDFGKK